jgi:hypothetical protein
MPMVDQVGYIKGWFRYYGGLMLHAEAQEEVMDLIYVRLFVDHDLCAAR